MELKSPKINPQRQELLQRYADSGGGMVGALAKYAVSPYELDFYEVFEKFYGKRNSQITVEEFLSKDMERAFTQLTDPEMGAKLRGIVSLRLEGQFSDSPWRRSYRSKHFYFYVYPLARLLRQLIRISLYSLSVKDLLYYTSLWGYEYPLAYELRTGNEEIIALLHEAVMGDNSEILLTREIIEAIIISGHKGLLDDLMKLLLAAQLQEGLRQQILEAADRGASDVLARIIKVCLDENLFRFSSTVRAFDVWTGMGFGDAKPAGIQKYAQIAYDCLTDAAKRQEYAQSDNNIEAYFALWAHSCHEFYDAVDDIPPLLDDPRHYRKILGWLFVDRMSNSRYQMIMASQYLEERDEELLAWITGNLAQFSRYSWNLSEKDAGWPIPNPNLPESKEERKQLFYQLKDLSAHIGSKKRTFTGNPFDFVTVTLSSERVHSCMLALAGHDMDSELIGELLVIAPQMTAEQRQVLIRAFLLPEKDPKHRAYLQDCLGDRSIAVKTLAVEYLGNCKLLPSDLYVLAGSLRSKSSDLRAAVLSVFKKQTPDLLVPLVGQMCASSEEYQNQAAIELALEFKDTHPQMLTVNQSALNSLRDKKLSTQTQILLDQLLPQTQEDVILSPDNGFGIYDPKAIADYLSELDAPVPKAGLLSRFFKGSNGLLSARQIKAIYPSIRDLESLFDRIGQVFIRHKDTEITIADFDGSHKTVLFGDFMHFLPLPVECGCKYLHEPGAHLHMIPFWDEFYEALGEYARDIRKMLGLFQIAARIGAPEDGYYRRIYKPWYQAIAVLGLSPELPNDLWKKHPYILQICEIFSKLHQLFDSHEVFAEAFRIYRSIIAIWGEENLYRVYVEPADSEPHYIYHTPSKAVGLNHRMLAVWRELIHTLTLNPEDFAIWFTLEYRLEQKMHAPAVCSLQTEEHFRAYHENLIPRDVLVGFLMDEHACMPGKIRILTHPNHFGAGKNIYDQYPFAKELFAVVLDRIVTVEEKRGELRTPLTGHCLTLERFEGAEHFCNLLAALGKENFFRGYEFSQNDTKQAVLSRLLKRCYPRKEDTPERLSALLKATDISDKRLAEAVMYAPQWADFAEKILQWPGLKCGVWFFHAHINETFSAEKETETAIYSPISPQQFNDGAFDKHWFFEAYHQLGEKRFQILYKSAKYITSGSNQHRRSQLYSDAVLGKLDARELMEEITQKRNQEKLRCYPLIPIAEGDTGEALRRYEFIQKFLKESKQFGAQRRESEKNACATAMENLAITTGLMDVNRLMWQMESQKFEQIKPLMEPTLLDGVSVWLTIDKDGNTDIAMKKDGKQIKTVPKSLAKNDAFLELKATAKELKDLKRRSRESLERAMTESTPFGRTELENICSNPILAPMVQRLVWTDGTSNGFLQMVGGNLVLTKLSGETLSANALRVAHPYDLNQVGEWAQYMQHLYQQQTVQPFKQVFREFYPITEDERQERTLSRRYEGHQVQPQRTVALLKRRGWTVDYEEGLQKVFYKENLIVRIFAMADWFSPADIEAPTLETVVFSDRNTGNAVPLEEVPPVLFSEVMRDLDLVVSVAHVGGVDPEASHSTTQMRLAIATELAKLLKLSNVTWLGSHAKIHGTLANYSVHMGSGVVHAEGIGMLSILPVHSQARGRIFLPFADDDPKTAEIMSKILLLAEDQKLKDPSILRQLSR